MTLRTHLLRSLPLFLVGGLLVSALHEIRGQDVGSSVVTAALGVPGDAPNSPSVYITWWPTGNARWTPASYAVFSKEGEPADPGEFTLAGIVRPQTDPLSVGFSIGRGERVGDDPQTLSSNIDGLFDNLVPTSGMRLSEKLAAIIDVSHVDPESAETLALLARRHPTVAFAAGVAFFDEIPQGVIRTYEIRFCPDGANPLECGTVAGRVVVKGGEIRYLPAPGQPVYVPFLDENDDPDPRGNLNAPLRWATPDALRERSFLQFGYDVYRVDETIAVDENWDNGAPTREDFITKMEQNPNHIRQVNHLPILTEELFSEAEAADLNRDPHTFFVIDDNRRYEEGGEPFEDGDTFYYFVAGRDLLGRPGEISVGTKVTICFRMPPQSPSGLKISNHYTWDEATDTQTQVFQLNWEHAKPRDDGPEIAAYWIYRWESIDEMQQNEGLPHSELPSGRLTGGRIATVPANTTEYIDHVGPHPFLTYSRGGDLDAPPVVNDQHAGRTFWYTVRAIDAASCSANISGNSAPAYGVLRDRVGPEMPDGRVSGNCSEIVIQRNRQFLAEHKDPYEPHLTYLLLNAIRSEPEVEWVEFYIDPLRDERSFLGRFYFEKGDLIEVARNIPTSYFWEQDVGEPRILAFAGSGDGKISEPAVAYFVPGLQPDPKSQNFVQFFEFFAYPNRELNCTVHEVPMPEENNGQVEPIHIWMGLTPSTEEWKLYRRVDNGPMTLLAQGIDSYDEGTRSASYDDYDLPLGGGRICYFLQVFDRHGNPSRMRRLDCITAQPRTPLPQPMLSAVRPLGEDPADAGARISWFAPPAGTERFQIIISGSGTVPPEDISEDLRPFYRSETALISLITFPDSRTWFRSFITGRVNANLGSGPDFSVDWTEHLATGTEYFIRVRAIGPGGAVSDWSNEESFVWTPEIDFTQPFDPDDCVVPWPVRGLPEVNEAFPVSLSDAAYEIGLKAEINPMHSARLGLAYSGGAVRVGLVRMGNLDANIPINWDEYKTDPVLGIFQVPGSKGSDLSEIFYRQANGTPLLNFMLYRYQVPNALYPEVSGDVYQVSPLIEGIAHTDIDLHGSPAKAIFDPYFFLMPAQGGDRHQAYHLYVKDTQPVIMGAAYRYLVVRFDESGEIGQVIPLPIVTAN